MMVGDSRPDDLTLIISGAREGEASGGTAGSAALLMGRGGGTAASGTGAGAGGGAWVSNGLDGGAAAWVWTWCAGEPIGAREATRTILGEVGPKRTGARTLGAGGAGGGSRGNSKDSW